MRAGLDLVLRPLGRGQGIRRRGGILAGSRRVRLGGFEAERGRGRVEEALFDAVEGALGEDVDAVDYVVDEALRWR